MTWTGNLSSFKKRETFLTTTRKDKFFINHETENAGLSNRHFLLSTYTWTR